MIEIKRYEGNPIISPKNVKPYFDGFEVIGTFNAGVAEFEDEIILLLRVAEKPISNDKDSVKIPVVDSKNNKVVIKELDSNDKDYDFSDPRFVRETGSEKFIYLTSLSYIRIARSKDGLNFEIDDEPFIFPSNEYQTFGIEDPRCTKIEDVYYITFTSVSDKGIVVSMNSTKDFKEVTDMGNILSLENKDVVLFPEKIDGKYYLLHRPIPSGIGNLDIWLAESPDLYHWGNHKYLYGVRGNHWENGRTGSGVPPIKTSKGWLLLYHAANTDSQYYMGAALLDLNNPSKLIARSSNPIMNPDAEYEKLGFFGDVVFGCGAVVRNKKIYMYYGAADTHVALCELDINEVFEQLTPVQEHESVD